MTARNVSGVGLLTFEGSGRCLPSGEELVRGRNFHKGNVSQTACLYGCVTVRNAAIASSVVQALPRQSFAMLPSRSMSAVVRP